MRQIRTSGSEGGEAAIKAVFPTPIGGCATVEGQRSGYIAEIIQRTDGNKRIRITAAGNRAA